MSMHWKRVNVPLVAYCLILSLLSTWVLAPKITELRLNPDATQNVRIASHLAHYGIMSFDRFEPPRRPTMKREPLPVFALAAWITLDPATRNARPYKALQRGTPLLALKRINLVWAFLIYVGIFSLVYLITANMVWRIVVPPVLIALTNYSFLNAYVDKLLTQAPAACFLVWAACFMLFFVRTPTRRNGLILGVTLAALALTKAAFFYISLVAIIVLGILFHIRQENPLTIRQSAAILSAVFMSFFVVVGIWVVRNGIEMGEFRIADRGGDVFYLRTLLMEQPILGALYEYSPGSYRPWVGRMTGYEPRDLRPGGSLGALKTGNPEDLRRARWAIYKERMKAAGVKPRGRNKAQVWLMREALKFYMTQPLTVLLWIPIVAYGSSFFVLKGEIPYLDKIWLAHGTLLLITNFLGIAIWAVFRRRSETCAVFLLPLGLFLFHAVFTHAPSRYNAPIIPFVWLAAIYTLTYAGTLVSPLAIRAKSVLLATTRG